MPELNSTFTVAWVALLALILLVEGLGIGKGGALTTHVHWLRAVTIGRLLFIPLWSWMTYHFWLDLEVGFDWWDAVAVAVGFVGAFLVRAIRQKAREGDGS